jgi:hypothetical protein
MRRRVNFAAINAGSIGGGNIESLIIKEYALVVIVSSPITENPSVNIAATDVLSNIISGRAAYDEGSITARM